MPQLPFTFQGKVRPDPEEPASPAKENLQTPPQRAPEPTIYSVYDLQNRLKLQLERAYRNIWVSGEISGFEVNRRSGHAYFSLKDRQASIKAVMFDDHLRRLRFTPEDGLQVLVRGTVTVWPKGGRLQLSAVHIEPKGLGALQQELNERIALLRAEGLTDDARKRPVPAHPKVIGVVTSRGSAALRDVVRTLLRRDPRAHVRLCFAPVQGRSAAFHIVRALERLQRHGACDVIVLARGGGSPEDLWAFNEEAVARAVVACSVPVITGIGHETDTTVADLVADLRTSTPTAAAEHAIPVRRDVERVLGLLVRRLNRGFDHHLQRHAHRLHAQQARLPRPRDLIGGPAQTLDDLTARADRVVRDRLERVQVDLRMLEHRTHAASPNAWLARNRQSLANLELRLERAGGPHRLQARRAHLSSLTDRLQRAHAATRLAAARERVAELDARARQAHQGRLQRLDQRLRLTVKQIEALSPLSVLARGYALAFDAEGRAVRDADALSVGDQLEVRLHRGQATVRVEQVAPDSDAPE